ncbi:hypothetical protein NL676_005851 [Syzygium grande]|nr:hypothetical protein NL676_005851 [Syzygium grande]
MAGVDLGHRFQVPIFHRELDRGRGRHADPSVPQVPYMTMRIFPSNFTCGFLVASDRKFVRLYFYPSSYNSYKASNAIFSVSLGDYTLGRTSVWPKRRRL